MKNLLSLEQNDFEGDGATVIGITYFIACMKAPRQNWKVSLMRGDCGGQPYPTGGHAPMAGTASGYNLLPMKYNKKKYITKSTIQLVN